jgi:hypothetical protein
LQSTNEIKAANKKDEGELETQSGQLINVKLVSNQETNMPNTSFLLDESIVHVMNAKGEFFCSNSCKQ